MSSKVRMSVIQKHVRAVDKTTPKVYEVVWQWDIKHSFKHHKYDEHTFQKVTYHVTWKYLQWRPIGGKSLGGNKKEKWSRFRRGTLSFISNTKIYKIYPINKCFFSGTSFD
jgi:hypothetical protein